MSADQISSNVLTDPVCQLSLLVVSLLNIGGGGKKSGLFTEDFANISY